MDEATLGGGLNLVQLCPVLMVTAWGLESYHTVTHWGLRPFAVPLKPLKGTLLVQPEEGDQRAPYTEASESDMGSSLVSILLKVARLAFLEFIAWFLQKGPVPFLVGAFQQALLRAPSLLALFAAVCPKDWLFVHLEEYGLQEECFEALVTNMCEVGTSLLSIVWMPTEMTAP